MGEYMVFILVFGGWTCFLFSVVGRWLILCITMIQHHFREWYCWWFRHPKQPPVGCDLTPWNSGISTTFPSTGAGFVPHQQYVCASFVWSFWEQIQACTLPKCNMAPEHYLAVFPRSQAKVVIGVDENAPSEIPIENQHVNGKPTMNNECRCISY